MFVEPGTLLATSLAFYRSQKGLSVGNSKKSLTRVPGASRPRGQKAQKKSKKSRKPEKNLKNCHFRLFFEVFWPRGREAPETPFDSRRRPTMSQSFAEGQGNCLIIQNKPERWHKLTGMLRVSTAEFAADFLVDFSVDFLAIFSDVSWILLGSAGGCFLKTFPNPVKQRTWAKTFLHNFCLLVGSLLFSGCAGLTWPCQCWEVCWSVNPSLSNFPTTFKVQQSNSKLLCVAKQHSLVFGAHLHFQSIRKEEQKEKSQKSITLSLCRFWRTNACGWTFLMYNLLQSFVLRGPAAILFMSCDICSDSIAKLLRACCNGVSQVIARYVAKWSVAQMCLSKAK